MKEKVVKSAKGPGGFALFVAWIGALVYYLQQAHSFGPVIVAILKSFVWPAFLVHDLLKFIS